MIVEIFFLGKLHLESHGDTQVSCTACQQSLHDHSISVKHSLACPVNRSWFFHWCPPKPLSCQNYVLPSTPCFVNTSFCIGRLFVLLFLRRDRTAEPTGPAAWVGGPATRPPPPAVAEPADVQGTYTQRGSAKESPGTFVPQRQPKESAAITFRRKVQWS